MHPRHGTLPRDCIPNLALHLKHKHGQHKNADHLVLVEDGRVVSFLSLPPGEAGQERLCFTDHHSGSSWDLLSERCWKEARHVHAHVHRGEITEDVLLEQCMEESCCTLPMPWPDVSGFSTLDPYHDEAHEHRDGCGHNQVAHGDHNDWMIPLADGSFLLSHAHTTADGSCQFFEHGRLVKVAGRPKKLEGFFSFQSPGKKDAFAYTPIPHTDSLTHGHSVEAGISVKIHFSGAMVHSGAAGNPAVPGEGVELTVTLPADVGTILDKTILDVMGICCPAEVPLIKKILEPLPGVADVSVNVTSRTVTVLYNPLLASEGLLVGALNEARLDASVHRRGELKSGRKWPSPWTIASGFLLAVAFFQYIYSPLRWVALGSVAVGIPPIMLRSMVALRRFIMDINVLMILAVGGAVALGDYLEAGSITFLFTLADWLESRSSDRARAAMASVLGLTPQHAVLLDTGLKVRVEDVKVGTPLVVRAGEMIPIDGVVTSGKSTVDESALTGESIPVEKETDSTVWAGTMNLSGYVSMKTTALSENSAVARMVRLVEESQTARSRTEQMVEKFAKYYTPMVVVAALLIAIVPAAVGVHGVRHWLYLALVLLVVACPCALVISTPVATTCGITQAARSGVLIKGGSHLESLGNMKVLAVDKTGTLTEGHFRVLDVKSVDSQVDVLKVLYWIACVESKASHPMAAAMVSYARAHGVEPSKDVADFQILPGEGVSASVEGQLVRIGNVRLASRLGWAKDPVAAPIVEEWKTKEATAGWVGVNDKVVAIFSVGDKVRPDAAEALSDLKRAGIHVVMLTGDSELAAAAVRRQIGDIEVYSQLLPEDKVRLVEQKRSKGVIGMIGDGFNDAPALAAADVGIAMGVAGSAVAMETADVALMSNDLRKIAGAVHLGQACLRKVQQNIFLSLITKVAIVVLAAVGYASLWVAVLADVGTCLVVTFNSMLLLKRKKQDHLHSHEPHEHCHGSHGHEHQNGLWGCFRHKHGHKHGRKHDHELKVDSQPCALGHKHGKQDCETEHHESTCCPSLVSMESRAQDHGGPPCPAPQCCVHDMELGHEHAVQKCCDSSLFTSVVRRRLGSNDGCECQTGCKNLMGSSSCLGCGALDPVKVDSGCETAKVCCEHQEHVNVEKGLGAVSIHSHNHLKLSHHSHHDPKPAVCCSKWKPHRPGKEHEEICSPDDSHPSCGTGGATSATYQKKVNRPPVEVPHVACCDHS